MNSSNTSMHKQLEFIRINDFFSKTSSIYSGLILNIIITSFLVAPYTSMKAIIFWIVALSICYIPRIIYTLQYYNAKKLQQLNFDNIQQWENKIFYNCILPFIAYSSLVFLPFEGDVRVGFMVAALSLISLLVGGSIIYSSSKKILNLYLFTCFSFLIARCLYEGTYHFYLLSIYFLVILIFISRLINTKYNNFLDHIASRLKFEKESLTDPLTGLPNRRHMEIFMEKFMPASRRSGHEFQVVMLDIDYFKKFNDTYGHIQGDKVLVDLASIVNENIHNSDFFVRYGGEEFILILTAINTEDSLSFLEMLSRKIENQLHVTVSLGLASSKLSNNFDQLINLSDKAMYQSKKNGRNQLTIANKLNN